MYIYTMVMIFTDDCLHTVRE